MGIPPFRVARTRVMSATSVPAAPGRRSGATAAAFLVGLPMAAAFLAAVGHGLLRYALLERYLAHRVEQVEVVLFGCALGTLREVLERSLRGVPDGLSLAFAATALALSLTMVTMFLSFLVERAENGVVEAVDRYVDRELAHRLARSKKAEAPAASADTAAQ